MTVGALISLCYDAVEPLGGDRDALAAWAALCFVAARSGAWGVC